MQRMLVYLFCCVFLLRRKPASFHVFFIRVCVYAWERDYWVMRVMSSERRDTCCSCHLCITLFL
jgi:hypothetical protein